MFHGSHVFLGQKLNGVQNKLALSNLLVGVDGHVGVRALVRNAVEVTPDSSGLEDLKQIELERWSTVILTACSKLGIFYVRGTREEMTVRVS